MVPHLLCLSSSFGRRGSSLQLHLKVLLCLPHVLQLRAQILHLSLMLLQPGDRRVQGQKVAIMMLQAETAVWVSQPARAIACSIADSICMSPGSSHRHQAFWHRSSGPCIPGQAQSA